MRACSLSNGALQSTLLNILAILSLELMVGARGYVLMSLYDNADCKGEPLMVSAASVDMMAAEMGGGQCAPVPNYPGQPEGTMIKFRSEEDGAKCFVDIFHDANCGGVKETLAIYTGECKSGEQMQAGLRRLTSKREYAKIECVAQIPEKLDWDSTCVGRVMAEKAQKERNELDENPEKLDSMCFKDCLKDPETETKWVESKEAFEGAFKAGGCAAGCDDEQKEIVRIACILRDVFDCNYKMRAEMEFDGNSSEVVTV